MYGTVHGIVKQLASPARVRLLRGINYSWMWDTSTALIFSRKRFGHDRLMWTDSQIYQSKHMVGRESALSETLIRCEATRRRIIPYHSGTNKLDWWLNRRHRVSHMHVLQSWKESVQLSRSAIATNPVGALESGRKKDAAAALLLDRI